MEDLRAELRRLLKPRVVGLGEIRPTIAFDGGLWLQKLAAEDPMTRVVGGLPLALEARMRDFVAKIKEAGPKPIFVFEGLPFIQEATEASLQRRQASLRDMWVSFLDAQSPPRLPRVSSYSEDCSAELFAILKSCGAEVFRAPYRVSMQLAFLSANSHVAAVCGDLDLLVYDTKRIIVDIDLERSTAAFIENSAILTDLQLTRENLLYLYILKGYCTGKEMVKDDPKFLISEIRTRSISTFLPSSNPEQLKTFSLIEHFVRSQIVTKPEKPETTPLHPQTKLESAIGLKFDHEVYFAVTVTPLSFQLLAAIASHRIAELPPVADSRQYRLALERIVKTREVCYSLLVSNLNEAFRKSEVSVQYWFGGKTDLAIQEIKRMKWVFSRTEVEQEMTNQGRPVDFCFCLKWHLDAWRSNSPLFTSLGSEEVSEPPADSHKDVLCRIFFKFLEMSDFIGPSGEPTVFGKALMKYGGDFQFELFLVLQMLAMGVVTGHRMSQKGTTFLPKPAFRALCRLNTEKSEEEQKLILLVARVASVLPPKLSGERWTGELSYPIAQFFAVTRLLHRNYRLLLEAIVICEFCNRRFSSPELFRGLGEKLPFRCVPSSALGIAVQRILQGASLAEVQSQYPQFSDLQGDLTRAFQLWKSVFSTVAYLCKSQCLPPTALDTYTRADAFFAARYEQVVS